MHPKKIMNNLFGTDGIRAAIGTYPLTTEYIRNLGHAIAHWLQKKYNKPRILIAHDTRESGPYIKSLLISSLLEYPFAIFDAYTLTTPATCQLVLNDNNFDCGIIISASHNPYYDNGIKIIDREQGKLTLEDEIFISIQTQVPALSSFNYRRFGTLYPTNNTEILYKKNISRFFTPNFLQGLTIVLDCAHGASYQLAPEIFKYYGATVHVIHAEPNGTNINEQCGAVYPAKLRQTVLAIGADVGISFDGDGDRVIMVNRYGSIKNGDDLIALLTGHPAYKSEPAYIGTIISNQGLEQFLRSQNRELIRTAVGDKYVSEALITNNLFVGGEQSGHIILRDYLPTGDGIFTALRALETMLITGNKDLETFEPFPQITINVPITHRKNLDQEPFNSFITASKQKLPTGRLIVRYSGTESIIRIMVEERDTNLMHLTATEVAEYLKKELN
jgi:phosphoglucosamine mutase